MALPTGLFAQTLTNVLGATPTAITFKVPSGALQTDPDSGNITPATTDVIVNAVLNPNERIQREQRFPGVDNTQTTLTGNVTDASTNYQFPDSVRRLTPIEGTCTWNGVQGKIQVQIPGAAMGSSAGERFYALFTPRN